MLTAVAIAATICFMFECNADSPRIVGGRKAELGEFPMMAEIMKHPSGEHHCGGSVITKIFVLSAAHCFKRCVDLIECATKYRILVGDVNRLETENSPESRQLKHLKTLIPHEEYDPDTFRNDIILIELSTNIVFSENVAAGVLATLRPVPHETCIAAGWGRESLGVRDKPVHLLAVTLRISEEQRCVKNKKYWQEGMICVSDPDSDKSTCYGDSGGPLICNGNVVAGIVCYGRRCTGQFNGFTDVSAYKDWIFEKIQTVSLRNGCQCLFVTISTFNFVGTVLIAFKSFKTLRRNWFL